MNRYLFTPGPVPVSPEASLAAAMPMTAHRGKDFSAFFLSIQSKLGRLLDTNARTIVLPSSGTGALESLAANFTGPDTKVLSVSCGVFGDRFREIVARTGAKLIHLDVAPGKAAAPECVAEAAARHPDIDVLLLTHNETSTGVCNPIEGIVAALPGDKRPLVLVDGVSSVGGMACYPEKWGIDGLAAASQKGLLVPPGLGFVWLSERARYVAARRDCPSYYFDLKLQQKYLDGDAPENPYTPPVSLYYALDAALDFLLAQGPENWFAARRRAAAAFAAGLESLGFSLLVADAAHRSPGVTAFGLPAGDIAEVSRKLKEMGLTPAGGQGALKGKILRMAHYHDFNWPEISLALGALYAALGAERNRAGDFMKAAYAAWEGEAK